HRQTGLVADQTELSAGDSGCSIEPLGRHVLGHQAGDGLPARARDWHGRCARHGALPVIPGRGAGRFGRGHPGDGARRPRRYDGPADLLHDRLRHSRHAAARQGQARQDRRPRPPRRRGDRRVPEDRLGLLRAVVCGGADGGIDRARQETRAAVCGLARRGVRALRDVLRRAVQARQERPRADHPGRADRWRESGAQEMGRRGETDDGGGDATTPSVLDLKERNVGDNVVREPMAVDPAHTGLVLGSFAIYSTWVAWINRFYEWGPYLSPFYSPLIQTTWWPLSPAFLILVFPLAFRTTCYYYRKAYYRAFFLDPVACG